MALHLKPYLLVRVETVRDGKPYTMQQLVDVTTCPSEAWKIMAYTVDRMQYTLRRDHGVDVQAMHWSTEMR